MRETVIHIYGNYPRKQGSLEEYFLRLTRECSLLGLKTVFAFSDRPPRHIEVLFEEAGAQIVLAPTTEERFDPRLIQHFMALFRTYRPTVINISFGMTSFNALLAARILGIRGVVWTKHSFDMDGPVMAARTGIRKFVSMSGIEGILSRRIIAVSDAIKRELLLYGIAEEKIRRIYLGINVERFAKVIPTDEIRSRFGLRPEHVVVTAISEARPEKGIEYLVRAVPLVKKIVPNVRILLVGGGPLAELMVKLSWELQVEENVIQCGVRDDIEDIIAISQMSVLPSIAEGLGFSVLESMAGGKPVIASNVGGIPEIIRDGVNGFLVPSRDPEAIAQKITTLLAEREFYGAMSAAARQRAADFDLGRGVLETIRVYKEVIAGCG